MKKKFYQKSKIQWIRYSVLLLFCSFFVLIPLSNRYANYKISYNQARLVELADGPIHAKIYSALNSFYSLWEDPVTAATSNNGSLWAYTVLGVPISDPLGLISELINYVHFPWKYLVGGLIPFFATFILGRFFCSWLCPMEGLFRITKSLRSLLLKLKFPLIDLQLPTKTRVILFWSGLVLSYFWGAWIWHFILPYISFSHEIFSIIIFSSFTAGIYFLVAVLVLDIGLIPGQFCKSVCPTGFLLSWLGKFSLFTLKAKTSACPKGCSACLKACPVDLYPGKDELYSCHLCYKCVDVCPKKHIQLALNPIYKKEKKYEEKFCAQ